MSNATKPPAEWSALLVEAVQKPGVISAAYSRFWNYSVGNQFLAWFQCIQRGIALGPIHTFLGWKDVGRRVKKGEKAITLCMPVQVKRRDRRKHDATDTSADAAPAGGDGAERAPERVRVFVYRPHWFVLAQTDGQDYQPMSVPAWDEATALHRLCIDRVPFEHPDGNCQGYAAERRVAVSPIAFHPHRTLFHELAHVVLGHTEELRRMDDTDRTPKNLREVEAESVALICCESLGLGGGDQSRGYIQHWLVGQPIPEKSAQRIFKAADQLLKAGYPQDGQ
jgi:antirestriction protein ArdC